MFVPELCSFYILSGGQSSRFGSDKAIAEVDGLPLALHIARVFESFCDDITIVSDGLRDYSHLGLRTIHDTLPNHGPCAGISAAFSDRRSDWIFVASCDLSGVTPSALEWFRGVQEPAAALKAERWQPLFAAYHDSIAQRFHDAAEQQEAAWRVLESVGAHAVTPLEEWARVQAWNTR